MFHNNSIATSIRPDDAILHTQFARLSVLAVPPRYLHRLCGPQGTRESCPASSITVVAPQNRAEIPFIRPLAASRSNGSGGDRVIPSAVLLVYSEVQEIRRTIFQD